MILMRFLFISGISKDISVKVFYIMTQLDISGGNVLIL